MARLYIGVGAEGSIFAFQGGTGGAAAWRPAKQVADLGSSLIPASCTLDKRVRVPQMAPLPQGLADDPRLPLPVFFEHWKVATRPLGMLMVFYRPRDDKGFLEHQDVRRQGCQG